MTDQTPTVIGDAGPVEARPVILIDQDGQPYSAVSYMDGEKFAAFGKSEISTSGYALLVDLSTITGAAGVSLSGVYLSIDRDTNSVGKLRLGVVTAINATAATVVYMQGINFEKASDAGIIRDRKYLPSRLRLQVSGGDLPHVYANEVTTGITAINTATALESPFDTGGVIPAVGDIVLSWTRSAGEFSLTVGVHYMGEMN